MHCYQYFPVEKNTKLYRIRHEKERNDAIMLACSFACDCNVTLGGSGNKTETVRRAKVPESILEYNRWLVSKKFGVGRRPNPRLLSSALT
ncbi:unnamed protein product [Arabidopsis halleri]